jgi:hypothetical protein
MEPYRYDEGKHSAEIADGRWTQPVPGELGMSYAEQQALWDEQTAELDPSEQYWPGYTEPPLDWEPEPDEPGPPAIERICEHNGEPVDGWGSPADLTDLAERHEAARHEAEILTHMEADFEAGQ